MPDVGVLNLTIKDNSEKAGQGLRSLADALSAVKTAMEGFNLSPVGQQVTQLAKTIQEQRGASTIIKNLGAMFNAVNQFSKIKSLNIDTEKIRDMAVNMLKFADAKDRVDEASKSGAGVSDWRSNIGAVSESTQQASKVIDDAAESITRSSRRIFSLQLFGGRGNNKKGFEQLSMDLPELKDQSASIEKTNEVVERCTETVKEYTEASAKKVAESQELAKTEEQVAEAGKKASKQIQSIITYLNKPFNYKGLDGVVNALTGVARGERGGTMIDEKTTMFTPIEQAVESFGKIETATSGLISIFDKASESWQQVYVEETAVKESTEAVAETMEKATSAAQEGIALLNMPASGKNGLFANANEEMTYLISKIEEAKRSQQQFNDIEANARTQLKHGGPIDKDELAFNLKYATEGYYKAAEAEEVYQEALRNLMTYVTEYAEKVRNAAEDTAEMPMTSAVEKLDDVVGEAANGGLEAFKREIQEITESTEPAISKITLLRNKADHLWQRVTELRQMPAVDEMGMDNGRNNAINNYLLQIGQVNEQISKLVNKAHEAQEALQFDQMKNEAAGSIVPWTKDDVSNLVENYTEIDLLTMKLEALKQALADDINQGKLDTEQIATRTIAIQDLKTKIDELTKAQEENSSVAHKAGTAWEGFTKGIGKMFPTLTRLVKQFKGTLISRSIRYAIRTIASGFREGVENVYNYSKAVGTSFAPAMDLAATSIQQMKNTLGASLAPVIQSLIPVLQSVVNWFISLVNVANQFFALINGQSQWTRALPQATTAFKDQTKAAKGASSAMKDLLADWDELNIIQSQNNGGGAASAAKDAVDYSTMFEEVYEFDDKIKNVVEYIKDHFDDIVKLAKMAGLLILGWKLSNAFGTALQDLKTFVAGVALVITGITLSSMAGESAGMKGYYDTGDILTSIGGALATALGGALIGSMVAGVPGAVAGFVIGLAASVIVNITSFAAANKLRQQKLMWGDSDYSPEQIREFIKNSYTFDIEAKINKINLITENAEISKTNLDNKITEFNNQYELTKIKCQLEADDKGTALDDLQTSANAVITAFNARQDSNMETIKASIELLPLVGKDGEEYTQGMIDNLMVGNQGLKDYMKNLGKDIAEAYNEGIKENWGKGTEEAYLAQIDRLNKIVNEKEKYVREKKFEQSKNNILAGMSYDNAQTALEEIQKWNDQYIQSATELLQTRREASLETAGYWAGIINDLSDQYTSGAIDKTEYFTEVEKAKANMKAAEDAAADDYAALQDVEKYLLENDEQFVESIKQFREKWLETLRGAEGYDFAKAFRESDEMYAVLMNYYNKYRNGEDINKTGEAVVRYGIADREKYEYELSPLSKAVAGEYGFRGSDMMSEENMRSLVDYFLKDMGFDPDFVKSIFSHWDLSSDVRDNIFRILKEEINYSTDTIPLSIENAVKDALEGGLTDVELKDIEAKFDLTDSQINQILNRLNIPESSINHSGSMRYNQNPSDPYAWNDNGLVQTGRQFAETGNELTEGDMSKAIETGTTNANRDQNDILNSIMRGIETLIRKEWTVNMIPSATMGFMNAASNVAATKISGD